MSKLKQEITAFEQKAKAHLANKWKNARSQIEQANEAYEKFIAKSDIVPAIADLEKLKGLKEPEHTPKSATIPPILRFGHLLAKSKGGKPIGEIPIPLLLPYAENNAVLFDMENAYPDMVPALFQTIALRFLLTMKMKVCKFYFIDSDFGNSFSLFKSIINNKDNKNKQLQCEMLNKLEEINQLIDNLEETVSSASYLGSFPNLSAYNAQAGLMPHPYHFIFIDDFPNVFSNNTAFDRLFSLINKQNAVRVGIHIFINYCPKNDNPNNYDIINFDINRFKDICGCICANTDGEISFHNWSNNISFPNFKIQLDTTLPKNKGELVNFINQIEEEKVSIDLDGWIEDLKNNRQIWKESTVNGIKVPIGFITPVSHFDFYLANDNDHDCNDFFGLVAGRPGYGKTVLLHNIIVNSCMKYPPDELHFYLADFAEGASFNIYRELPHVKSLMLSNNKEYALRMLEHLVVEARRRSILYDQAVKKSGKQVTTLAKYRKILEEHPDINNGEKLPRIVFVMDEFHYLFNSIDKVTNKARVALCDGIKQWRKFGINIILCTQDLTGVDFGDANSKITYRFALNLLEWDSNTVIRNDAAKSLLRKGQTIMNNTSDGNKKMNIEFQCAFTNHYLDHVKWLAQVYKKLNNSEKLPAKYVCESGTDANIAENTTLFQQIKNNRFTIDNYNCDVFVGKPDLLRDKHTRIHYRRQENSNTLILGDDYKTAINTVAVSLIQMHKQSKQNSKLYVVDCFDAGNKFRGALDGFEHYSKDFVICNAQSIVNCVNEIEEELDTRKQANAQGQVTEERIVLAILNIQGCDELRSTKGEYGGTEPSPTTTKLVKILDEGAAKGIHCIVHALSYESLKERIFDSDVLIKFENKIFLKGIDIEKTLLNLGIMDMDISRVDKSGQMIVLNAKIDDEDYEQCNAYSEIPEDDKNAAINFISKLFKRNHDA